ncbi:hypothetical protein EXE53_24575 [Halorubrum sp. SD626R]|uniref:hypothetical protein n=1 Tax=Halorubrum TaxID=56688 RepID=UPI0010F853C9|nr:MULTISPECIES: hypothetical protein [Halorubrum]TKX77817.1 hypothetical protein EXE53_24575 [Halorubrum sp. SD626R]
MGLLSELKADVVGFVRNPTDEQKLLFVAVIAMAISDRFFYWVDFPIVVRTTAAVGVGFIVLFVASYLYTGSFVPPDGNVDDEDEEDDTYVDELDP